MSRVDESSSEPSVIANEWDVSLYSKITFSWLYPLIKLGHERQLKLNDIGTNNPRDEVETHLIRFQENIRNSKDGEIIRTIWKTFSSREYYAVGCKFLSDLMSYVPPLCINYIVSYAEKTNDDENSTFIWFAAVAMILAATITSICNHWFYQFVMIDGLHARTAIQAAVYAKMLRISKNTARGSSDAVADTIVNLQSTDCRSIEMVYWLWMYAWAAPLQVIVTTVLLYLQLGWPVFVGITLLLLMGPLQKKVMSLLTTDTLAASKSSDERIKLITEIIKGIQVVKLQAWEDVLAARVQKAREIELKHRRSILILNGANTAMTECAPILCTIVTFLVYGLFSTNNTLTAATAFTALSLFDILRNPLFVLPMLINVFAGGSVAAKRLGQFLYSPELKSYVTYEECNQDNIPSVEVRNASFVWKSLEDNNNNNDGKKDETQCNNTEVGSVLTNPFTLYVKDLKFPRGTFTVITGNVGSGKSSFLSALLGEMDLIRKDDSSIVVRGSISYCAQEPWIQNTTLRNNILFGSSFDRTKYDLIIKACALGPDIASLPGGDHTEIGERGINLSGGQKARISLARACYADNNDIVILDDILSAVDAHVARTIVDECLLGILRDRTVILATHQTFCLPHADTILEIKDGSVTSLGDYPSAMKIKDFSDYLGSITNQEDVIEEESSVLKKDGNTTEDDEKKIIEEPQNNMTENTDNTQKSLQGKLTKEEKTEEGAVTAGVYLNYAKMMGLPMFAFIILLVISVNGSQVILNWWLSRWSVASSNLEPGESSNNTIYYLTIYFVIGFGACLLIFTYQFMFATGGIKAAAGIHNQMFKAILHAPMSFFDTTPSGQILNRFTADMKSIDEVLINYLSGALTLIFMMISVLLTMILIVPYILIALLPLFLLYGWIQRVYRNSARELKRFDSATQSPIFNFFVESLNGLSSIRAYRCEDRLLTETKNCIDYNTRYWTKNNFVNRWLGLRLDWIGAAFVGCAAVSCILAVKFDFPIDAGLVGLVLSYTATLTNLLNWGVRRLSEAEMGMVAVERTRDMTECQQEYTNNPTKDFPSNWPRRGSISLNNVIASYRKGLPNVLNGINVDIPSGTSVGICGRTGSGKTTLAKCLFRLIEITGGSIEIDGLDISNVELSTLRSKITMIPQDPTLFAGPLRYSLDPANQYTDDELWSVLSAVDMKSYVEEGMEDQLDSIITDGGDNLSAGQKQLLCMARALLEKSSCKILIMDEATSNIDNDMDTKIQRMLRERFSDYTILTIAHRIDTVLWYDKVMVLDEGKVLEFDSPDVLSKKVGSEFRALLTEYSKKGR